MVRRFLNQMEANRAVGMLSAGVRQVDVAGHFGVSQSVISRLQTRFNETNSVVRRRGQGRRRITTAREDRFLTINARRHPTTPSTSLRNQLRAFTGRNITARTVRNRLHEVGLASRRLMRGVPLQPHHKQQRLEWARLHINWGPEWNSTFFTDESRIGIHNDSRRIRIWRTRRTPRHCAAVQEIHPFGGGSVMIWAGLSYGRRTPLYIVEGNMTANLYREDIINGIIEPLAIELGDRFIFVDDNARPHRGRVVLQAIEDAQIHHLPLPPLSPDLNPIEHAWSMLKRALETHQPPPTTLNELKEVLPDLWNNLPQEHLDNLVLSMPRRCRAVLEARGGHTRY